MNFEPTPPPPTARAADLSDAECAELDALLDAAPEPLVPLDAPMLDGFLCGTLVQPVLLEPVDWLRWVFDEDGRAVPDDADPAWLERSTALIAKRHAALRRAIVEDGWFEPLLYHDSTDDEDQDDDVEAEEAGPGVDRDVAATLTPIQRALLPWVAGFVRALDAYPALVESSDDAVGFALARVLRHMPTQDDEQAELQATLDREMPLTDLDEAIADLVDAVVELQDLTRDERYRVETVRHEMPKVGRNDKCTCGSGKKFKHCHGRG